MNVNIAKVALYVVLILLILFCGGRFLDRYSTLMSTEVGSDPYESAEILKPVAQAPSQLPETNIVSETQASAEAAVEGSPDASDNPSADPVQGADTESTPDPVAAPPPTGPVEPMTKGSFDRGESPDAGGIGLYVVALFGLILALGVLAAHDISTFLGQRTHKLLLNEEGEGIYSVEYDAAEETWAKGDYLDAIRMMREYLNKHPKEVHVMIRIAEIYEKDLGNFLAAALEYEELLKYKLQRERWGWAAIHLVNLYFGKIDKAQQGIDLLYRIHREYGETAAAEKARKRLLQLDTGFQAELDHWEAEHSNQVDDAYEDDQPQEQLSPSTTIPEDDSNLPKGFRKKR